MDKIFFEQLNLSSPDYNLDVRSGMQGAQTAAMLSGIENVLLKHPRELSLYKEIQTPSAPERSRQ
jgi:UDP-N-acetylglucosamine 2-epimerase